MICINGIRFENGVCLRTVHAILGMPQVLTMYLNESSTFLLPNDYLICLEWLFVKIIEAKKDIPDISYNSYQ